MDKHEIIKYIVHNISDKPIWENWYIREKIGSGTFSEVYRVEGRRGGRIDQGALKIEPILPDETAYSEADRRASINQALKDAENETNIMLSLQNCPNIVRYEDETRNPLIINGRQEGFYVLIRMELLQCVHDMLRRRVFNLTENNVISLAKDIANALKVAHGKGILHRDLKPANLFYSNDGIYKLGDFNVSKPAQDARTFAGTPDYMAPEVYRNKTNSFGSYTKQADIYSLGIILYFLMNGLRFPYEGDNNMSRQQAFEKRMSGERLMFPKFASEGFGKIILKASAFNTNERYNSADELLYDLQNLERGIEPAPVEPSDSKPKLPIVKIAVMGILVLGAIVSGISAGKMFMDNSSDNAGNDAVKVSLAREKDIELGEWKEIEIVDARASSCLDGDEKMVWNLFDKKDDTCWKEGAKSLGLLESVELDVEEDSLVKYIKVKMGDWKDEKSFLANSRPKRITIDINGGEMLKSQIEFRDEMDGYVIVFSEDVQCETIKITIDDTYEGNYIDENGETLSYSDTAITEITAYGA